MRCQENGYIYETKWNSVLIESLPPNINDNKVMIINTTVPTIKPIRYPLSPIFLAVILLAIKQPNAILIDANGAA